MREGVRLSDMEDPKREIPIAAEAPAANSGALTQTRPASFAASTGWRSGLRGFANPALRASRRRCAERASRTLISLAAATDIRSAEIAKLELLKDQLCPILDQLPKDCDLFDIGVAPGDRPRLFIDQIGFVEMERDRRSFRFLQDTRHGRITIADTESAEVIVEAVTTYIAHRLIERERALASDYASGGAAAAHAARVAADRMDSAPHRRQGVAQGSLPLWQRFLPTFLFLVEALGSAVFFAMILALCVWLYRTYMLH